MAGLNTYNQGARVLSAAVGYALLQSYVQLYLTNSNVTSATTAQDLIDAVNAAIVPAGSEANAQRLNIVRAIERGKALGDLSDSRVAAATSVNDLAVTYTWVSSDPNASVTGHLGTGIYGG